ncbi:hypothetical protein QAD02_021328 [Eretmocerus hayati]|uniref:Uncharacterized protein n=1 Tax=Eretmocerus hayati TaxID=131215 RepID=A0ACC2PQ59_9HYME|nr:hypothetical protein QAD02_021328 [Eretmocerus hayati]
MCIGSAGDIPTKLGIAHDMREYSRRFCLPHRYVAGWSKTLNPHHPVLTLSTKTLMGSHVKISNQSSPSNRDDYDGGFTHVGVFNTLLRVVDLILHPFRVLELQFSFDGLTLFDSSKRTSLAILGKIYTEDNDYQPFVVAIDSGVGKPKCSLIQTDIGMKMEFEYPSSCLTFFATSDQEVLLLDFEAQTEYIPELWQFSYRHTHEIFLKYEKIRVSGESHTKSQNHCKEEGLPTNEEKKV